MILKEHLISQIIWLLEILRKKQKLGRHDVDYKNEIVTLLDGIQSEKFMKFLYNMIISFKKQWGY